MRIRPNMAYRHANYPTATALDPGKVYNAIWATNQPNWKERGLVFVDSPAGAPEMLLDHTEYKEVE